MPERRDATDDVAGQPLRFVGAGAPQARSLRVLREPPDVDAIGPADERDDRGQARAGIGVGCHEHEALDDLPQLGADRMGGLLGRVGGSVERDDVDVDPGGGRGVADSQARWMRGVRHGPESIGSSSERGVPSSHTRDRGAPHGAESVARPAPQTLGT